ncbi:unnamed protein product [Linum tenue]|uniref:Uncharacterized protein n=1 Tax=Linum tenue TaxID=586396 RepID=A0AAV0JRJ1_9ROSI|nr:unnamed protein product [Linum tenue]
MTENHSWQTGLQRKADLASGRRIRISTRRSSPSFRIRGFASKSIRSRFLEPPRSCSLLSVAMASTGRIEGIYSARRDGGERIRRWEAEIGIAAAKRADFIELAQPIFFLRADRAGLV